MALDQGQLLTLAGVLVILFLVIVVNNVAAMRARAQARSGAVPDKEAGMSTEPVHPLLVKFARHEGSVVGETVALDGDHLILKQAGMFKSVPRSQAEVKGDEVVLTGHIDWPAAATKGAEWHGLHRASAIPEVSGTLTRSEDVKAPAMESTRDR